MRAGRVALAERKGNADSWVREAESVNSARISSFFQAGGSTHRRGTRWETEEQALSAVHTAFRFNMETRKQAATKGRYCLIGRVELATAQTGTQLERDRARLVYKQQDSGTEWGPRAPAAERAREWQAAVHPQARCALPRHDGTCVRGVLRRCGREIMRWVD